MAELPIQFRKTGEPTINSYSATDVITGKGYITFNAYSSQLSGSNQVGLTTSTPYSRLNYIATGGTSNTTNFVLVQTYTFDSEQFSQPKVMDGRTFFTYTIGHNGGSSGGFYFQKLYLIKYSVSSATEETLAEVNSEISTLSTGQYVQQLVEVNMPRTTFTPDDKLRFKLESYEKRDGVSSSTGALFGVDPQNRDVNSTVDIDSAIAPTFFHIDLPFTIQI